MKTLLFLLFFPFLAFAQIDFCREPFISPCDDEFINSWHGWSKCARSTPTVVDRPARTYVDSITKKIVVIPATFKTLPEERCTCFDSCKKTALSGKSIASIYPSSVTDFIVISMAKNATLNFQIVDLTDRIVFESHIQNQDVLYTTRIPNGIYFMVFSENDRQYRNKVMINR